METLTTAKTVFIVEDSLPIRARLLEMFGDIKDVNVVGEAGTPAEAITGILRTLPDYVILDFQLDGGTGIEVLRAVRAQVRQIVFIVLTNHPQLPFRHTCMEAGADAFFDKSFEINKVRDIIAGIRPACAERTVP